MTTPGFAIDYAEPVNQIIERVLGGLPLQEALAIEGISPQTFHKWLGSDKKAAHAYARAQEMRADFLADQALKIADTERDAAVARNQIDIRKWLATKLNSRVYGDRVDLNVTQTIDIGSTLAEARSRVIPARYQYPVTDAQVVDSIGVSEPRPLDNQSNSRVIDAPAPDAEPDIFS